MKIVSVEDQLALMRQGLKAKMELKLGGLVVSCRLLSMTEEATVISNAKKNLKVPEGHAADLFEGCAVQKAILNAASTVDGVPQLSLGLLDKMTDIELGGLYDQYLSVKASVDPEFETMPADRIVALIQDVKKKEIALKDLYTWQLAAIGKFFLDQLPLAGSAAGG